MSCPAQDGGLSKIIKYYILSLACAGSSGDALKGNQGLGSRFDPHPKAKGGWSNLVSPIYSTTR